MKLKIIKEIPGYKGGEIVSIEDHTYFSSNTNKFKYLGSALIEDGFAEEIKDNLDIEWIRRSTKFPVDFSWAEIQDCGVMGLMKRDDLIFLECYRFVKEVINQLNGDWKPDWEAVISNRLDFIKPKWFINGYSYHSKEFILIEYYKQQVSFLPAIKSLEIANEIIKICESELKILFGVK